jgi:hypothetical protein
VAGSAFRQRYPKTRLDESRSGLDVEAIAAEVGYSGGHTLRMPLRERLGRGVRQLRADLR